MANYGEELAYWYLRLNGFFALTNFVIHRTVDNEYSSDCDVLALRAPYTFEPVGGQPEDWDTNLFKSFKQNHFIGIICQVKTGKYTKKDVIKSGHFPYLFHRLGLSEEIDDQLEKKAVAIYKGEGAYNFSVGKLLIAHENALGEDSPFLFIAIEQVREFLKNRIRRYPKEKWQDRFFFNSELFQSLIDEIHMELK